MTRALLETIQAPRHWLPYYSAFQESGQTYAQTLQAVGGNIKPKGLGLGCLYHGPNGRWRPRLVSGGDSSGARLAIACFRLMTIKSRGN